MALGLAKVSSIRNLCWAIISQDSEEVSKFYREMIFENVSVEIDNGLVFRKVKKSFKSSAEARYVYSPMSKLS